MKVTQKQIDEWKKQYSSVYELEADGLTCYVFSPLEKLAAIKQFMTALTKGSFQCVDALFNNCWLAGDEAMRTDNKIKMGLVDKVVDFVEYPDPIIEFSEDGAVITIEGKQCKVRLATRMDVTFAEERNKAGKALDTQIYLLERIAKDDLAPWKADNRLYVALLTAMDQVKERTAVSLKKL